MTQCYIIHFIVPIVLEVLHTFLGITEESRNTIGTNMMHCTQRRTPVQNTTYSILHIIHNAPIHLKHNLIGKGGNIIQNCLPLGTLYLAKGESS